MEGSIKRFVPQFQWLAVRRWSILRDHRKVVALCDSYIEEYSFSGERLFEVIPKKTDWEENYLTVLGAEIKELVDVDYPDAERIVLVCDNLNTHNLSSLYETFESAEACRIGERLELYHTPKQESRLDIAEIELSAFTKGCLDRRISTIEELQRESTAWYKDRNKRRKGVDWPFSVGVART